MATNDVAGAIPTITGALPANNPFAAADALVRSLNRTRVIALPGVAGGDAFLGRSASELLSAPALTALVRAAAGRVALDPDSPSVLRDFNAAFDEPATRPVALAVADEVGRRLGAVLLVLWRGDAPNRAARPEWDETHWAYWRDVRRVVIGGGLLAGRLGEAAVPVAAALLAAGGCPIVVERSPFGEAIALAGLARHAPADAEAMLLFDFGHTAVKCGLATYDDGTLTGIKMQPPSPPPCEDYWYEHSGLEWARPRWAGMSALIADAWAATVPPGARQRVAIGLSLASHLQDGHPIGNDRGCYTALKELSPHLATFVRDELAARLGLFRALVLIHDGLAAASTHAGEPHTVVLTLGTAIGSGYGPEDVGLRPSVLGQSAPH